MDASLAENGQCASTYFQKQWPLKTENGQKNWTSLLEYPGVAYARSAAAARGTMPDTAMEHRRSGVRLPARDNGNLQPARALLRHAALPPVSVT